MHSGALWYTFVLNQGLDLLNQARSSLPGIRAEPALRLLLQPGQGCGHLHLLAPLQELLGDPPAVEAVVVGHLGLLQVHRPPGLDQEDLLGDEGLASLRT